jgi:hypothetical protein
MNSYDASFSKYSKEYWDDHWVDICDGKIVFQKYLSSYMQILGLSKTRIKEEVLINVNEVSNRPINKLISKITEKFK